MTVSQKREREFAEVVGWSDEQQKSRRKNSSALPWFKFYIDRAETPTWLNMSASARGDYLQCLIVASRTGNTIPMDAKFLRRHQLNRKKLNFLSQLGLISISSAPLDDPRFNDMRSSFVNNMSPLEEEGEEDKTRQDKRTERETRTTEAERLAAPDRDDSTSKTEVCTTSSSTRVSKSKIGRQDERPFPELKEAVRQVVDKHGWTDAYALHKFAGQSLRMSEKQIRECVRQLKQDGAI